MCVYLAIRADSLYPITSGPMLALCLARESAVAEWRKVLGPKFVEEAQEANPES